MFNKVLLLNLPYEEKITRRYMCSYVSPTSLLPPYELVSLGSSLKAHNSSHVSLIDAIALNINLETCLNKIYSFSPDIIFTITGFESYQDDINTINKIKSEFKNVIIVVIGHYPTLFPEETLTYSNADFVLKGEPDLNVINLIEHLESNVPLSEDIVSKKIKNSGIKLDKNRIKNIDSLPIPLHELANSLAYGEPLLPKPFGMIQSARGCPYQCNFCVKSYGSLLTLKSPEHVIEEIKYLVKNNNINSFRFIDDTFTVNRKRVIEICNLIIKNNLNHIQWTCLSRPDNIDEELLILLKKAGCKRIYFGIETGSQKVADYLKKNINVKESIRNIQLTNKHGIQTAGFFMIGIPNETDEDIEKSIQFSIEADLDFIAIGKFTPYPGTSTYNYLQNQISFNLYPYQLSIKGETTNYDKIEKKFLMNFYLRKRYILKFFKLYLPFPKETIKYAISFINYALSFKKRALNHINIIEAV